MSDSIVIIPTYNERENIEKIIRAVFGLPKDFDILVIDDGSPDGTASIVKHLMSEEFAGKLHLMERSGKLGLGTAYIAGFKWALEKGYEYVIEMDADFSHNPEDLPRLYAATHDEGYDVAIGSRYVTGVNVVNWPMGRVLMSYFASKYVQMVTGIVLVNVERAMIRSVIEDLMKIEGVSEVYSVAGEYDLVVMIRVKSNAELAEIIATRMTHDINGIIHTKTLVTLNAYSKLDLEKIFLAE